MIHIGRAGTKLGSFSEFEVRRGLASGQFFLTDLGWKQGMENWAPLSDFPEFQPEPPPSMPPLPGEEGPFPVAPSGLEIPEGLPWDHRKEIGFIPAFVSTAQWVLFNPAAAFLRMSQTGGVGNPLLYNLIGGWIGAIASGIYLYLTAQFQPAPEHSTGVRALFYLTPATARVEMQLLILMGPIIVTVSVLLGSAIAHLLLMLAGGANKAFHVTLRVFCYSYGSAQLLQLIPACGNLLSAVWMLICCMVGLAAAHNTSTGRSVAAILLLIAVAFACCAGTIFLALGADYQAMRPLMNQ